MAAQATFCLFRNVFFSLACNTVPENWHICVNKGHTYLLKNDVSNKGWHIASATMLATYIFRTKRAIIAGFAYKGFIGTMQILFALRKACDLVPLIGLKRSAFCSFL